MEELVDAHLGLAGTSIVMMHLNARMKKNICPGFKVIILGV